MKGTHKFRTTEGGTMRTWKEINRLRGTHELRMEEGLVGHGKTLERVRSVGLSLLPSFLCGVSSSLRMPAVVGGAR